MYLSSQSYQFVRQLIATIDMTSNKLLIKYHKTINKKGEFTTIMVIPSKNFNRTLSKFGYSRIKTMIDKSKLNYSQVTIVQAYDLK